MNNITFGQQNFDVSQFKSKIDALIKAVDDSNDPQFVEKIINNIKVARKLWEIKKQIDSIRDDLLILEINCLTKIVKMGHEDIISSSLYKSAALYFAEKTHDEITICVKKHKHAKTAISLKKACLDSELYDESYLEGVAFASHKSGVKRVRDDSISKVYILSVEEAVDALVQEFIDDGEPFTIAELSDSIVDGRPEYKGFRNGVKEMCRKAVRSAKTLCVGDMKAPRFVTSIVDKDSEHASLWARVPFENACLLQLKQMIALREDQLNHDIRALENLNKIKEAAENEGLKDSDLLGSILANKPN